MAIDIVLLTTTAGVFVPNPSPPAAAGDSSLGSVLVALGAWENMPTKIALGRESRMKGFDFLKY